MMRAVGNEQAREAFAAAFYANVGRLMEKHSQEPHRIEDYFDLSLIRTTPSGPTAPVPQPPVTTVAQPQSAPATRVAASGPISTSATMTPVTEIAPRLSGNGNGIREHNGV